MKPSEVLRKARALIEKPERWTKGWFSRDADGAEVSSSNQEAVCWCSVGAIWHAVGNDYQGLYAARAFLAEAIDDDDVTKWNDRSTHEAVVAAFDRAIALAEESAE